MHSGEELHHQVPTDFRLALPHRIQYVEAFCQWGGCIWVPEQENIAQAVRGSVRQSATWVKAGEASEGKNSPPKMFYIPGKCFERPE